MGLFGEKKYGDGRDAPITPKKPPVGYDSPAKRAQEAINKGNHDSTNSAVKGWESKPR